MKRTKIDWLDLETKIFVLLRGVRERDISLREAVFGIDAVMGDLLKRGYVFDVIDDVPKGEEK